MIERGMGEYANPASMLKAAVMLLRHIGMQDKAAALDAALETCMETEKRLVITGRPDGASCREFGDYVMEKL